MTTIKTQDLTGAALDWAVAQAAGEQWSHHSTDWSQGGPLIDSHEIYFARCLSAKHGRLISAYNDYGSGQGKTHLEAACRAIVAAKLGDEVDVPEELV